MGLPIIESGDRVWDTLDNRWRTVARVRDEQIFMADGGVMGIEECKDMLLPSEAVEISPYRRGEDLFPSS